MAFEVEHKDELRCLELLKLGDDVERRIESKLGGRRMEWGRRIVVAVGYTLAMIFLQWECSCEVRCNS